MLVVGLPSGLETSEFENCTIVSGVTMLSTLPLRASASWKRVNCAGPVPVKSSSTLWPGFIVMTVSIAWPPNSRW